MKKILISLVMVGLMVAPSFAGTSHNLISKDVKPALQVNVGDTVVILKQDSDVLASKTVWSTCAINKNAHVSDLVVGAVSNSIVTFTDSETTPNTLLVVRVPAGTTQVINFNAPMIGSSPTTISALDSIKASATASVSITLIGWEK